MPFTVKAPADKPGAPPFVAEKQTKTEAIRAAVSLIADGIEGVTIIDEDGEVYHPDNFRAFFHKGPSADRKWSRQREE
jgi:hypothetical protein